MTLGIGGWGSRRKPMSLVRALLRTDVTDLTVVSYGGPDVGLLCAAGKIRKLVYGFVSLDSIPLEPHFRGGPPERHDRRDASSTTRACCSGRCTPGRCDCRSCRPAPVSARGVMDVNPSLRTVTSPYDDGRGAARRAGDPARRRVRPPQPGRRAGQRPVPRARPLLRRPVPRRVRARPALRVVRADRRPPSEPARRGHRSTRCGSTASMVDGVIEAPNGAHFTTCEPDYGRDEAFQKAYVAAAGDPDDVGGVRRPVPVRRRGRLPGGRRRVDDRADRCSQCAELADVVVVAAAEAFRGDGEIFASGMGTIPMLGARARPRHVRARPAGVSDGEAFFVANDLPIGGTDKVIEGWIPFRWVFDTLWGGRRHVMMGATQIDRYGNSNIANIGPWEQPKSQLLGVRGGPGNTINHADSFWIPRHTPQVFVAAGRHGQRHRLRPGREARPPRCRRIRAAAGSSPTWPCSTSSRPGPHDAPRQRAPRGHASTRSSRPPGSSCVIAGDVPTSRARRPPTSSTVLDRLDPKGLRHREVAALIDARPLAHPALRPRRHRASRSCRPAWAGSPAPRLVSATANAGGLGILASATMDFDQLRDGDRRGQARTSKPFGVNLRADAGRHRRPDRPADRAGRAGGQLRPGARRRS